MPVNCPTLCSEPAQSGKLLILNHSVVIAIRPGSQLFFVDLLRMDRQSLDSLYAPIDSMLAS